MSEPTAPSAPASPPSGADPGAALSSVPNGAAPAAADTLVKPDFLPADYWDEKAGIKTDEFAKHYGEVTANAAKLAERMAAVPAKPDDYKVELALPEGTQLPEGVTFDPAKDPRLPTLLKTAHELGLTNTDVNKLVALDAQFALANHQAEQTRLAEETKKLGDKATDRIAAANNWLKGLTDKGDLTADEAAEVRSIASSAAGVTALEKLMAKANGGIPGHVVTPSNTPSEPKHIADRIWPSGFSPTPQARTG